MGARRDSGWVPEEEVKFTGEQGPQWPGGTEAICPALRHGSNGNRILRTGEPKDLYSSGGRYLEILGTRVRKGLSGLREDSQVQ